LSQLFTGNTGQSFLFGFDMLRTGIILESITATTGFLKNFINLPIQISKFSKDLDLLFKIVD